VSTNLFLRGELRIKPGHEAAIVALAELVQPEEYSTWTLNGNLLEIALNEDVPYAHYSVVWDGLIAFVDDHCETAAALQTGPSERDFAVFGSDEAQREAAYIRYCDNEIEHWTILRANARVATRL
jgi:hypothetical protein